MNFTLFGYPRTGKTTLFNILSGSHISVKAYDDGKKEPNQRACPFPDGRLEQIWRLYSEKKKIAAHVDFIDLAGISYGEVKNSLFLNALRKADALAHVVRGFHDDQIPHHKPSISPGDDIRTMEEELLLSDLVSVESRMEKLDKDLKKAKSPEGEKEFELLGKLRRHLEEGHPLREYAWTEAEEKQVRNFAFLSQKPILYLINIDESDAGRIHEVERAQTTSKKNAAVLAFCGKIEQEILEIENEEEKNVFLAEYGLRELTAPRFFPLALDLLEMIFFFTIGKDEVRAWPIRKNSPALKAAGSIHTDIEKGFIRAEVITWKAILEHGSLQQAKDRGAIRLEGKEYIVQDGDVIYFRFAP
jgi:hypothetical protein